MICVALVAEGAVKLGVAVLLPIKVIPTELVSTQA